MLLVDGWFVTSLQKAKIEGEKVPKDIPPACSVVRISKWWRCISKWSASHAPTISMLRYTFKKRDSQKTTTTSTATAGGGNCWYISLIYFSPWGVTLTTSSLLYQMVFKNYANQYLGNVSSKWKAVKFYHLTTDCNLRKQKKKLNSKP